MKKMDCQQFQENLPEILEIGGNEEEEGHLRTCKDCAILVQDLEYIGLQAKLLMPMHDPSPRVWAGIEQSLQREGLLREGRTSRLGNVMVLPHPAKNGTVTGWLMAAAAMLAFAAVLVSYHPKLQQSQLSAQNSAASSTVFDGDDQQVLSQVAQQEPAVRQAYETSLREVNAYIADARQAVKQAPEDTVAQEHLSDAYQQKEMLYQMASAHGLP
jgi:hypothetical protein